MFAGGSRDGGEGFIAFDRRQAREHGGGRGGGEAGFEFDFRESKRGGGEGDFSPSLYEAAGFGRKRKGSKKPPPPAASAASLSRCRAEKEKPFVMLKGSEGGGAFCQNKGGNLAERLPACMVASFLDPSFFLSESSFF